MLIRVHILDLEKNVPADDGTDDTTDDTAYGKNTPNEADDTHIEEQSP